MSTITTTRNLHLRALSEHHLESLYAMFRGERTLHLWSPGIQFDDFAYFKTKLLRRVAHRWDHFTVFEQRDGSRVIGLAYCYNTLEMNNNTFICLNIAHDYMGSRLCLEAGYSYLNNLFEEHGYRQLYGEVFAYNTRCLGLLRKLGFKQQGLLNDYQYWNGQYWDQYIFVLNRKMFDNLSRQTQRLRKRFLLAAEHAEQGHE